VEWRGGLHSQSRAQSPTRLQTSSSIASNELDALAAIEILAAARIAFTDLFEDVAAAAFLSAIYSRTGDIVSRSVWSEPAAPSISLNSLSIFFVDKEGGYVCGAIGEI
jgi:hypothetical protein